MNSEVESAIAKNTPWSRVAPAVRQALGNSEQDYDRHVMQYSIRNQLKHRGNLGKLASFRQRDDLVVVLRVLLRVVLVAMIVTDYSTFSSESSSGREVLLRDSVGVLAKAPHAVPISFE